MNEQRNLILAVGASLAILLSFNYFYDTPKAQPTSQTAPALGHELKSSLHSQPVTPDTSKRTRDEALAVTARLPLSTPELKGTINLVGGVLDDIILSHYQETPQHNSSPIVLLSPSHTPQGYYCEFGWTGEAANLPNKTTSWTTTGQNLSPDVAITLHHDNGAGLKFERVFAVDRDYLFTITERVTNTGTDPVVLRFTAQIVREETPAIGGYYILHEGPLGVLNNKLKEIDYQKLIDKGPIAQASTGGWLGITDKYWLVSLIPQQKEVVDTWFKAQGHGDHIHYFAGYTAPTRNILPGQTATYTHHVFAGTKKLRLLDAYEERLGLPKFDLAVDFGWFYFLTKPLFYFLEFLNKLLGNFGMAILVLTIVFKIALYPLAAKSMRSMAQMKKMQPQMEKLKERYANDSVRLQQEMMEMYRREKINPLAGCLPLLVQAPIFFCLYKVLFVTIEMRHAPFFGWIDDLSAPDPTTLFNLFGLIPWAPPSFLLIGAWPIIMGLTMFLQQRLSPQPADPSQAKALLLMPVMLTFLLAQFPAGLLIYWSWTNILSILQQWYMTRQIDS